jgi:hypothetical protein
MQAQHRWFRFGGRGDQATARWDAVRRGADGIGPASVEGAETAPVAAGSTGPAAPTGKPVTMAEPHSTQARSGQSGPCPSWQGGRSNSRSSPQVEQYKGDLPRL